MDMEVAMRYGCSYATLKVIANFTSLEFAMWLKEGLLAWHDYQHPELKQKAFEPINSCFNPDREIEPQLASMAKLMDDEHREKFFEGLLFYRSIAKDYRHDELFGYLDYVRHSASRLELIV